MRYITKYLNRAWYILGNEGTVSLLRKAFSSYIFSYKEYYVRQHFAGELDEADFSLKVEDFTFEGERVRG